MKNIFTKNNFVNDAILICTKQLNDNLFSCFSDRILDECISPILFATISNTSNSISINDADCNSIMKQPVSYAVPVLIRMSLPLHKITSNINEKAIVSICLHHK